VLELKLVVDPFISTSDFPATDAPAILAASIMIDVHITSGYKSVSSEIPVTIART
jgi:hypothetical protein